MSDSATVSTQAAFNSAIETADNLTFGAYAITIAGPITLSADLEAINLHQGVSLVITGSTGAGGGTLNGAGAWEGLFVYQGDVTVQNLTITDTTAKGGKGGDGGVQGAGGGAGLGGGLFIAGTTSGAGAGGNVTLANVIFTDDSALGGAGGVGQGASALQIYGAGGGGLGGNGGNGGTGASGGGGGVGTQAVGGTGNGVGGAGIIPGAGSGAPGRADPYNTIGGGGPSGGGGGGGYSGGGGGAGAHDAYAGQDDGGFGGGGGGDTSGGGNGGFGGGGGSGFGGTQAGGGATTGGHGGFGGGGGGGSGANHPGQGGFGGGNANGSGSGGGGLGAGGDIFVQQGASLTIESGTLGPGTVTGGAGANQGAAFGTALFLQGADFQTFAPAAGQTLTIAGAIDDEHGSQPGYTSAAGGLVIDGAGTVFLAGTTGGGAASDYTGGTTLDSGTLILGTAGAAGSGPIVFNGAATLIISASALPAQNIENFGQGDAIIITGFAASTDTLGAGTLIIGDANGTTQTLTLSGDLSAGTTISGDGTNTTLQALISTISTAVTHEVEPGTGLYAANLSITSTGTILGSFSGIFANAASTLNNAGRINANSNDGIYLHAGGAVSNATSSSVIYGHDYGVLSLETATVTNAGAITGSTEDGIFLHDGGSVANTAQNAIITGGGDGVLSLATGTVSNAGTISGGTGDGVFLHNGGSIGNTGVIYGGTYGVFSLAGATVTNNGTIAGGTGTGIYLNAGGTITTSGTVQGRENAIYSKAGSLTLKVLPGAVFSGGVDDHAGTGKLVLAGSTAGTLNIGSFTGFSTIHFARGADWTLDATEAAFSAGQTISGFTHQDVLDITDLAITKTTTLYANSNGSLDLPGAADQTLTFSSFGTATPFILSSDGAGGADLTIPCFAAGTRILGLDGEICVENIRPGDLLITMRNNEIAPAKVIWTGKRAIDIARHPAPDLVRPIRIMAGAIADNIPERDLRLSPEHAVYLGDNFYTAESLVNGVTVFQEQNTTHVTYHHIELENHVILLAEGLACESFLDTGNKTMFASVSGVTVLHPDFAPPEGAAFCAPVIRTGAALNQVRAALHARILRRVG